MVVRLVVKKSQRVGANNPNQNEIKIGWDSTRFFCWVLKLVFIVCCLRHLPMNITQTISKIDMGRVVGLPIL